VLLCIPGMCVNRRMHHLKQSEKNGILKILLMNKGLKYASQDRFVDALSKLSKEMMRIYPQKLYPRKSTIRESPPTPTPTLPKKIDFGTVGKKKLKRQQVDWGFLTLDERKWILNKNCKVPQVSFTDGNMCDNTVAQLENIPTNQMLWIPPELSKKLEMTRRDLFHICANDEQQNPLYCD